MSRFMKNHARKIIALTAAIGMMAVVGASALDAGAGNVRLSSNLSSSVGVALTAKDISAAEQALNKTAITSVSAAAQVKAEADAKAQAAIAAEEKAKAEAAAKAQAEAEAKAQAANAQADPETTTQVQVNQASNSSSASNNATQGHTVSQPTSSTDDSAPANATSLGQFRLSFYCPCAICNGTEESITKLGTTLTEGRTIAVDSSVIPLGSRVYIEGFGTFVAEDTGGAIKGSRIDILVSSHERAYELGVQYANVYILN